MMISKSNVSQGIKAIIIISEIFDNSFLYLPPKVLCYSNILVHDKVKPFTEGSNDLFLLIWLIWLIACLSLHLCTKNETSFLLLFACFKHALACVGTGKTQTKPLASQLYWLCMFRLKSLQNTKQEKCFRAVHPKSWDTVIESNMWNQFEKNKLSPKKMTQVIN